MGKAARGIVAAALVLGGLGAEGAAISGFGVGAGQALASSHAGTSHQLASSGAISQRPWMY